MDALEFLESLGKPVSAEPVVKLDGVDDMWSELLGVEDLGALTKAQENLEPDWSEELGGAAAAVTSTSLAKADAHEVDEKKLLARVLPRFAKYFRRKLIEIGISSERASGAGEDLLEIAAD
jgi:hypothetical protein